MLSAVQNLGRNELSIPSVLSLCVLHVVSYCSLRCVSLIISLINFFLHFRLNCSFSVLCNLVEVYLD